MPEARPVEEWLNDVDYTKDDLYIPGAFALEFINFIKLVNGEEGEENESPVLHYKMLDQIAGPKQDIVNMVYRGAAKTTLLAEYLVLYLAVYGGIPGFGDIPLALYVSDSIDNGVKNMRKNLEYRWENSEFLKFYIPHTRFTDVRWEFTNKSGGNLVVKGYGAKTGVRGTKEKGQRPRLAILDDLVSDEDARSGTIIASIEDTIYKAIDYALHPKNHKIIWSGTPFNSRDPLYKAVESGAWHVNVYPVCNEFPVEREFYVSSWGDRFTYDYVLAMYTKAKKQGKLNVFNQEMMLRIMSDEERLVPNGDIGWYKHSNVLTNRGMFNFYITTDFATSENQASDYSVISVWALNNKGYWYWVDGICKRQLMSKNIDDLFRLCKEYNPQEVGVEITGQQKGFISWIQSEQMVRNIYFTLAREKDATQPGIRPVTDKMVRFNVILPKFTLHQMWFPIEMKDSVCMVECMNELSLASQDGFKSKKDDFIDNISMLSSLNVWLPSEVMPEMDDEDMDPDLWSNNSQQSGSYVV